MNFKIFLLSLLTNTALTAGIKTKTLNMKTKTINSSMETEAENGIITTEEGSMKNVKVSKTLTLDVVKYLELENAEIGEKLIIKQGTIYLKNVKAKEVFVEEPAKVVVYIKSCKIGEIFDSTHAAVTFLNQ